MENTDSSRVTIKGGDIIQFQGLLSDSDATDGITGIDDIPPPEETTESKAEESVASDASLAEQLPSPPAFLLQAPAPPSGEVTPQAETSVPGVGGMAQTSPLGFSVHRKVSNIVCHAGNGIGLE